MRFGRRRFMIGAGLAALAGVAGFTGYRAFTDPTDPRFAIARDAIADAIATYAPGSRLPAADLDRFVREFAALHRKQLGREVRARRAGKADDRDERRLRQREAFERLVMHDFGMATDYFQRAPGDRRTVRLVRPLDPYAAGCGNPLARFDFG